MKTVLKLPILFIAVIGAVVVADSQGNGTSQFMIVDPPSGGRFSRLFEP